MTQDRFAREIEDSGRKLAAARKARPAVWRYAALLVPVTFGLLHIVIGLIQVYIFGMLTLVFITGERHEDPRGLRLLAGALRGAEPGTPSVYL